MDVKGLSEGGLFRKLLGNGKEMKIFMYLFMCYKENCLISIIC